MTTKGPKQPRKTSEPQPSGPRSVLPMQLQVGDRFTDETGEWEIASHPYTIGGGRRWRAGCDGGAELGRPMTGWWRCDGHERTWPRDSRSHHAISAMPTARTAHDARLLTRTTELT